MQNVNANVFYKHFYLFIYLLLKERVFSTDNDSLENEKWRSPKKGFEVLATGVTSKQQQKISSLCGFYLENKN